jgi:hypothetical protein
VALCDVHIPAPGVHVAELVLEAGEPFPVEEGRGGLVIGQRCRVLAQQRVKVADGLVQRPRMRVLEREGRLVVGQGVPVGVDGPRVVPGEPGVLRGLGVLPGQPVVVRGADGQRTGVPPAPNAAHERLGDAAV